MQNTNKNSQLLWGLGFGVVFGFLLQKGGVTRHDVIVRQLLLTEHTVLIVMLSAMLTGMIGLHIFKAFGLVKLAPKSGSISQNVIGGLTFGIGFALLGYCPGTLAGAIGNGYLDALLGGLPGILIGAGLFAALYPKLQSKILKAGYFGDLTLPRLFNVKDWVVVVPAAVLILLLLILLQ